jgi:hypothetical protein
MSLKRFARISVVFATVLCTTIAVGTLRHTSPVHAAQAATEPCCGVITPQGNQLAAILDSMNVEKRWLAHEHINWETGEADEPATYTGPGKSSHCSAFAAAVGERLNVYMLRPPDHSQILLASAQAEWFHDKSGTNSGWKPIQGADHDRWAQELANQGNLVVIVYESPDPHKPGHIVIVRPSDKSLDALHKDGPQIAQAGMENYNSSIAANSFNHHPGAWPNGVHYYWHFVDWSKVKTPTSSK